MFFYFEQFMTKTQFKNGHFTYLDWFFTSSINSTFTVYFLNTKNAAKTLEYMISSINYYIFCYSFNINIDSDRIHTETK